MAPLKKPRRESGLCTRAGTLLLFSLGIVTLVALMIGTHLLFSTTGQTKVSTAALENFSPLSPALWPAGSPLRHPETLHPGIALAFAPGLELYP